MPDDGAKWMVRTVPVRGNRRPICDTDRMSDDEQTTEETTDQIRRPWRTPDLPPCVGFKGALEILDVGRMTLSRWLKPGSGSFPPDNTYMVPPARIDSGPFWVRSDVEAFAIEFGRQRAASGASGTSDPPE